MRHLTYGANVSIPSLPKDFCNGGYLDGITNRSASAMALNKRCLRRVINTCNFVCPLNSCHLRCHTGATRSTESTVRVDRRRPNNSAYWVVVCNCVLQRFNQNGVDGFSPSKPVCRSIKGFARSSGGQGSGPAHV